MAKKGRFIVLEGIDGSGTTTQVNHLHNHLKSLSKYADILTTHEPWDSDEIRRKLREDEDAYSGSEEMTHLFVSDRSQHLTDLIIPNLRKGVNVISDRYSLSTFAYQGAQGDNISRIADLHSGMLRPALTFFLDVDYETAKERIAKRGESLEKFEKDEKFIRKLIGNYRGLYAQENLFGKVVRVEGGLSEEEVSQKIASEFSAYFGIKAPVYELTDSCKAEMDQRREE